jgi:hypothetical protein
MVTDETTWGIRGKLRRTDDAQSIDREKEVMKWHVFLHLAQEAEDEREEAQRLLRILKEKDSPLKSTIEEEEEAPNPLEDLPEFDKDRIIADAGMSRVIEAWFSLFEEHLQSDDILLTLSPPFFQFMGETWEEWGGWTTSMTMEFQAPDFSHHSLEELMEAKVRLLDKSDAVALLRSILEFRKGKPARLAGADARIDLEGFSSKMVRIALSHFPIQRASGDNEIVRYLSGKTIGLIEEGRPHE